MSRLSSTGKNDRPFGSENQEPVFVIWAPSYDETNGGTIALHTLCDRLNQIGARAYIWSNRKPSPHELRRPGGWGKLLSQVLKGLVRPFNTGPFPPRIARKQHLETAIAIYPEVVSGNPWGANKVVRWFLYTPGFHTGKIEFGRDELYFFYHERFNDRSINPCADNLLRVSTLHPAYKQLNFQSRSGAAYIVRKGKERILNQHPAGAIKVDGLSHKKTAKILNEVKYFYSYDPYTMYSIYAALCGCISIVIPEPGVSLGEWYPEEDRRFGLAYGIANEQWAIETKPALIERLNKEKAEEDELVRSFVRNCVERFM
jgi:hypothetical protein